MSEYHVYDVFTDRPFGGNPLAIFPDATGLAEDHLQKIAREFNFSESTFVFPPENPAHTARVRIFTPTMEIPFAGHPTIGTAICLSNLGHGNDLVLELGVGPIACSVTPDGASFTTARPFETLAHPDPALIARCLGLSQEAIATSAHPPTLGGVGLPFVLVQLADRASLAACLTDIGAFREGAVRYPSDLDFSVYAYCRRGRDIDARMFAPLDNIPEDPATGSAAAALAAFLHQLENETGALAIRQGDDMGRPSRITAQAGPAGITISGQSVPVMRGRLTF